MKEEIRKILLSTGAVAVGFSEAGEIDPEVHKDFENWIGESRHGDMAYLERHLPLRKHTDSVLPGAKTVISLAFSYVPEHLRSPSLPTVAVYAYGEDYHIVLRERLNPIIKELKNIYGGKWRLCIDSTPLAERYRALKSGIGIRGSNGSVIVKGCGGLCFLAEILTTIPLIPDAPSHQHCEKCGLCIASCPGNAITGDGKIDARRCINYLTIEKKGEFTEEEKKLVAHGSGHLFGCDNCLRVCPHNSIGNHTPGAHFPSIEETFNLSSERILDMQEGDFKKIFSRSALSYAGYSRLKRNAQTIKETRK